MKNGLITRADDFGSAYAADKAVLLALSAGCLVKNVSCMAVGPTIEKSVPELVRFCRLVDFGLHFTLNAEWDEIKWKPCVANPVEIKSLLNADGQFHQTGEGLARANPDIGEILLELNAQLDRLVSLNLSVSYVDAHMFNDENIPGLSKEINSWTQKKGLLYVRHYYHFPPAYMPVFASTEEQYQKNVELWLDSFEDGEQYVYCMHPAILSDETMAFANKEFKPGIVAWERELEYRSANSRMWNKRTQERDIKLLRYRDAVVPVSEADNTTNAF